MVLIAYVHSYVHAVEIYVLCVLGTHSFSPLFRSLFVRAHHPGNCPVSRSVLPLPTRNHVEARALELDIAITFTQKKQHVQRRKKGSVCSALVLFAFLTTSLSNNKNQHVQMTKEGSICSALVLFAFLTPLVCISGMTML